MVATFDAKKHFLFYLKESSRPASLLSSLSYFAHFVRTMSSSTSIQHIKGDDMAQFLKDGRDTALAKKRALVETIVNIKGKYARGGLKVIAKWTQDESTLFIVEPSEVADSPFQIVVSDASVTNPGWGLKKVELDVLKNIGKAFVKILTENSFSYKGRENDWHIGAFGSVWFDMDAESFGCDSIRVAAFPTKKPVGGKFSFNISVEKTA